MPLVRLQTNVAVATEARDALLGKLSRLAAELLGKSEDYVMVALETGCDMVFGGTREPLAYMELKSIGLPGDQTTRYSEALCALVAVELALPENRIYIEFSDAERHLWGWNGKTFAR